MEFYTHSIYDICFPHGLILTAYNDPRTGTHPSITPSDRSQSVACQPFILVMSTSVAVRHTLRAHFYSRTTLDVAVCLHIPQTEVCPLCTRGVLGTTIGIAIRCISRLPFLPDTTLGMPSVFITLRPESVRCVLGL